MPDKHSEKYAGNRWLRFLRLFCPPSLYEGIEGDLLEQFEADAAEFGEKQAKRRLRWNVVRFFRPGIILRNSFSKGLINTVMWTNYFKIALRNMARYKLFSSVNLLGLSVGLAVTLLALTHIRHELSYETNFPKHNLIYRVATTNWAKVQPPLAAALKAEMPEIKSIGRFFALNESIVGHELDQVMSTNTYMADSSVFGIFDFPLVAGNPQTALAAPSSIVISQSIAAGLFKKGVDPIGKVVDLNGYQEYTITGVMQDLPQTTHLKIDCMVSMAGTNVDKNSSRAWNAVSTYVLFDAKSDVKKMQAKLIPFEYRFMEGVMTKEEIDEYGEYYELNPIADIHLHSHKEKETEANSDITYVYLFSALAVLIILIVSINFINLFVAQSLKRVKEIGVRKAVGASKSQLVSQFLIEALLIVTISGLLALLLAYLAMPFYNQVATIKLEMTNLFSPANLLTMFGLILLTGVISGTYPAVFISRMRPRESLSGKKLSGIDTASMRKGLVLFQFIISLALLISTLVVDSQMEYIHDKDLGFDEDQVVAVRIHGKLWPQAAEHTDVLKSELLSHPSIKGVSVSGRMIGDRFGLEGFKLRDQENAVEIDARYAMADHDFIQTMGIELLEGKEVPRGFNGTAYLLNEAAATQLQAGELIGQYGMNFTQGGDDNDGIIMGIVEDFHFASLHQQIDPLVIEYRPNPRWYANYLLIRIDKNQIGQAMAGIEGTIEKMAPGTLLVHRFLNDRLNELYESDQSLYNIFKAFSGLVILIACLGLFALAAYAAEARTKEIGIRKVLGASSLNLLWLFSRSYITLVALSFLIAAPLAWYFVSSWLAGFEYRTTIVWWMFVLPFLVVLVLAFVAISGQSLRIAAKNPVDSLRYE